MYPKRSTKAILLKSYDINEKDKALVLFTRNLGLLHTRAISMRSASSKLKQNALSYILLDVTLVQGKGGFRLVEAENSKYHVSQIDPDKLQALFGALKALLKFMPQNETHSRLFDLLLQDITHVLEKDTSRLELYKLKMLYNIFTSLGYVNNAEHSYIQEPGVEFVLQNKREIQKAIFQAEKVAQI